MLAKRLVRACAPICFGVCLGGAVAALPALAAETRVQTPGALVETNDGAATVRLPGVAVDTSGGGARVNLPGVSVDTSGGGAGVNLGDMGAGLGDMGDMGGMGEMGSLGGGTTVVAPGAAVIVNSGSIREALRMAPGAKGAPRRIDLTVNFDFNKDTLTPEGARQVEQIAGALRDPALAQARIVVEGHTDSVGGDAYNQKLSQRRAERVVLTLAQRHGLDVRNLSARGYGETRPVAPNDSDLGRVKNRRVTLVNMGIGDGR